MTLSKKYRIGFVNKKAKKNSNEFMGCAFQINAYLLKSINTKSGFIFRKDKYETPLDSLANEVYYG